MTSANRPIGNPTRGTTNPNRLRRVDRWLARAPEVGRLLRDRRPLVVDLGFGASPVTTVELARRLRSGYPDVRVLGLELDPDRVARARPMAEPPWLDFRRGGFELAGTRPVLVRACNVLRQYAESDVPTAWQTIVDGMAPGGLLVDGTCDEIGRLCTWLTVANDGPRSLTLSCQLASLTRPSIVAERLPKALIHRNVAGEPIHEFLTALDTYWATSAPFGAFGQRARWIEMARLAAREWPIIGNRKRWRLGELSVSYAAIGPRANNTSQA